MRNCAAISRDQRLEADVPAIFLRVERAVARNDPADVAGAVAAQQEARPAAAPAAPAACSIAAMASTSGARSAAVEAAEQRADLVVRPAARVRQRPRGPWRSARARLRGGRPAAACARDLAAVCEVLQDAAEIAGIEAERADEVGRGAGRRAARFRRCIRASLQRVRAVQQLRLDACRACGCRTG